MSKPHDVILRAIGDLELARNLASDRCDVNGSLTMALYWAEKANEELKAKHPAEPHPKPHTHD